MTAPSLPIASLSLDLDNCWSYLKTHGDPSWTSRPTYLPWLVPQLLDLFDTLGLRLTMFVVGVDAERDENAEALADIPRRGHEVGNHSHEHEPWLRRYSRAQLEAELARAEGAIERATGERPRGFRGPGFSWSPTLLEVLASRGYLYDASTLPTFLGPLARAYYFRSAHLTPAERAERAELFGRLRDGRQPLRPYRWRLPGGATLIEMPVTTMPLLRTPFHLSYLLYLALRSERLAMSYLAAALAACRLTGTAPSFLLHPLDFVGGDAVPALRFFPAMGLPTARKRAFALRVLRRLAGTYALVPLRQHVAGGTLPLRAAASSLPAPGAA